MEEKPAPPVNGVLSFGRPTTSNVMPNPPAIGKQFVTPNVDHAWNGAQTIGALANNLCNRSGLLKPVPAH